MASIQIVKRARPNKDGKHPLQLRLTLGSKSARLNIDKTIASEHWNDKEKCVKKSHPNYVGITTYILDKLTKANKELLLLQAERSDFTLQMLKQKIAYGSYHETFFSVADEYFATLELEGRKARVQSEKSALNHLRKFTNNRDLEFNDITTALMKKFRAYLIGTVGISERSVMNYLTVIRIIYKIGITQGHAKEENYPFGKGKLSIKLPESQKIGLDPHEVEELENINLPIDSYLNHVRNLWLFSFYFAGMRVSDVLLLKWQAIQEGRLYYTMGKNKKPGSLIIPAKAQKILDYYASYKDSNSDLIFPDMRDVPDLNNRNVWRPLLKNRNKKINKHLKILARMVGIDKPLTFHIARHTFGNIAGDQISLQKLKELYRHSSITTTINYQKAFMNKGADDALETVVNFKTTAAKKPRLHKVA